MALRVSVLLPTHNRADVLRCAIASVLAQTTADFEVLIVGDGCTDASADVVAAFEDPRLRWFDLPKGPGQGYENRNKALAEATGDLIAFLGDDALLFPDHLAQLARPFANPDVEFAYSRPLWVTDAGTVLPAFVNLALPRPREAFLAGANVLPPSCVMHRRVSLDRAGLWPRGMADGGDWDLWQRILGDAPARRLRFVRTPTCLQFGSGPGAPAPVPYLTALAANSWWPPGLRLDLTRPGPPQEQVWSLLDQDAERLVQTLRAGVLAAQDLLAWNAGLDANFNR